MLGLQEFMLYAHGSDLCHDLAFKKATANCFEALMGALFLDGGIEVSRVDRATSVGMATSSRALANPASTLAIHTLVLSEI